MSLLQWPWEQGIKPYFINEKGFEWYPEESINKYIKYKKLKGIVSFLVKKDNEVERILINDKQEIVYITQGYEAMACYIDLLVLDEKYKSNE